jgi:hypothetical protein
MSSTDTYNPAATYLGSGDPARERHDYFPWWLDNLADDATGEGAFMEGAASGAEQIRALVTYARTLYEYQEFNYAGAYGDSGFLEDYTTRVHGQPTGVVVTVSPNAAGQAQHIVVNHRPRNSVLLLANLCAAKFADTPLAGLFVPGSSSNAAKATYMDGDDSAGITDYYPAWLDNLAEDATLEGAAMSGVAEGAETVRGIIVHARTLYEHQVFSFTGPYGDNGFLEQYTTPIKGEPTGVVVKIAFNEAGEAQHVVVLHRPRSSMLRFSRAMGEQLAGSPLGAYFIAPGS